MDNRTALVRIKVPPPLGLKPGPRCSLTAMRQVQAMALAEQIKERRALVKAVQTGGRTSPTA